MRCAVLVLLLASAPTWAQTVYRCEDASGQRIFADQPCRHFGAIALPSESAGSNPDPSSDAAPSGDALDTGSEPGGTFDGTPPPEANGCPGEAPADLALALQTAAEHGNLNALAGMFHWPSAGRGAAGWVFATAERLVRAAPLLVWSQPVAADDAWLWAGLPPPPRDQAALPELQIAATEQPGTVLARFTLIRHAGCVWLLPR